jgi:hypothetical protein
MQRFRHVLTVALVALLLNSLLWSVGGSALADLIGSYHASAASLGMQALDSPNSGSHQSDQRCNEGCHIASHFQAMCAPALSVTPAVHRSALRPALCAIPISYSPPELFQPPRIRSRA